MGLGWRRSERPAGWHLFCRGCHAFAAPSRRLCVVGDTAKAWAVPDATTSSHQRQGNSSMQIGTCTGLLVTATAPTPEGFPRLAGGQAQRRPPVMTTASEDRPRRGRRAHRAIIWHPAGVPAILSDPPPGVFDPRLTSRTPPGSIGFACFRGDADRAMSPRGSRESMAPQKSIPPARQDEVTLCSGGF